MDVQKLFLPRKLPLYFCCGFLVLFLHQRYLGVHCYVGTDQLDCIVFVGDSVEMETIVKRQIDTVILVEKAKESHNKS